MKKIKIIYEKKCKTEEEYNKNMKDLPKMINQNKNLHGYPSIKIENLEEK